MLFLHFPDVFSFPALTLISLMITIVLQLSSSSLDIVLDQELRYSNNNSLIRTFHEVTRNVTHSYTYRADIVSRKTHTKLIIMHPP